MFTNEFDFEATVTTVLDETGQYQDVELIIDDAGVFIRQYPEKEGAAPDLIILTHKMFYDMVEALQHTEGFYVTRYNR